MDLGDGPGVCIEPADVRVQFSQGSRPQFVVLRRSDVHVVDLPDRRSAKEIERVRPQHLRPFAEVGDPQVLLDGRDRPGVFVHKQRTSRATA